MRRQSTKPSLRDLDADALQRLALAARERGRGAGKREADTMPVVDRESKLPLSFAQQQLWLLAQLDGTNTNYHIAMVLRLRGRLDLGAWHRSLDRLFALFYRHRRAQRRIRAAIAACGFLTFVSTAAWVFGLTDLWDFWRFSTFVLASSAASAIVLANLCRAIEERSAAQPQAAARAQTA